MDNAPRDADQRTASALHAARLEAGAACLDAALSLYLPRGLAPTCCCDPEHIGVGTKHARECTGRSWGKTPLHKWKHFQTTRPTVSEVQALWTSYPIGNVGCVLGQASGLVRIDVDGAEGEALLQEWSGGDLPPTWTFRSSAQGRGLLYAWPKEMPCKSTTQAEPGEHRELRLQANGAQTILPPSRHASGWRYTWDPGCSPTECELSPAPAWLRARLQVTPRAQSTPQQGKAAAAPLQAAVVQALSAIENSGDGVDYDTWLKVGMALHSLETASAWELWDGWSQQSTKYSQGKQEASWRSFDPSGTVQIDWLFALARSHGWRARDRAAPDTAGADIPLSDYFNALAVCRQYGISLHYCFPWKSWLPWTGTHWQRDDTGTVMQWAKATVRGMLDTLKDIADAKARDALYRHIKASLSASRLDGMVKLAQDEPGIPVMPDALDQHHWLLNCANGTLDLKTGTLQPHARGDLLTKCLALAYDPDATCPTWERFLWHIMGGSGDDPDDPDASAQVHETRYKADERARRLIGFLQRAVGYSLTGDTSEHCFFLLYGTGRNGKGTFIETVQAMLGPYGKTAEMSTFLARQTETVRNDLADLHGARFVSASEADKGKRLAESLVKRLTGGDRIKARFLFQEYFEFLPQMHVWLAVNDKPVIRGTDRAMWERIHLIPFEVFIPPEERDKHLGEKLRAELPGILAWAVTGCLEWHRYDGLKEPPEVTHATEAYRQEMDVFGRFLAECCTIAPAVRVKASTLYKAYQEWCADNGCHADSMTDIGYRLDDLKFAKKESHGMWRLGLGLNSRDVD